MANLSIRLTMYRLEQVAGVAPTFALVEAPVKTIQAIDIKSIEAVNALGGMDIGGFGYLYSKITMKLPGLLQELYAVQTVLQLQTLINS